MYSHELTTGHFFKNKSLWLHSIFGLVAGISIAMIIYPVIHFIPGGGRISKDDVRMYTRPIAAQQGHLHAATPGLYAVRTVAGTTTVFTTQPVCNSTLQQQLTGSNTESLTKFE